LFKAFIHVPAQGGGAVFDTEEKVTFFIDYFYESVFDVVLGVHSQYTAFKIRHGVDQILRRLYFLADAVGEDVPKKNGSRPSR
jgi:hypothetical protein